MSQSLHILDMLPAGCIILDDQGQIEYANRAFCETIAIPVAQLQEWDFTKVLSIPSQIFYHTHLLPILNLEGKVNEIFLTLLSTDGQRIPVVVNAKREQGVSGYQDIYVIVTIWERQKYEQELRSAKNSLLEASTNNDQLTQITSELEKQKQALSRKVAELTKRKQEYLQLSKVLTHDLQEPIRKVGIFYDRLLSDRYGKATGKDLELLNRIQNIVSHLRRLTESIERFVHYDSIDDQLEPLNVRELLDDAVKDAALQVRYY